MKNSTASRCLALRQKIDKIEAYLKIFYLTRIQKMENEAFSKMKRNSKAFYAFAKRIKMSF